MKRSIWISVLGGSVIGMALLGAYLAGHATAEGVPNSPPFYYSGVLEESGQRASGTRKIKVGLYATDAGGSPVCETANTNTTVTSGEFRVGLPPACAQAVKANADLWVRVTVDDMYSLPYTKLGAVPYAVEADNGAPPGTIVAFGGATPPNGWLLCDGSARHGADFPRLANAIKTAWGNGSNCSGGGSGDFCLPDMRGRFLRGVDSGASRDEERSARAAAAAGGNEGDLVGSTQPDGLATHTHGIADPGHSHSLGIQTWCLGSVGSGPCAFGVNGSINNNPGTNSAKTSITVSAAGGSETRPENVNVHYIIKY